MVTQPSQTTSEGVPAAVEKPAQLPSGTGDPLSTRIITTPQFNPTLSTSSSYDHIPPCLSTPAVPAHMSTISIWNMPIAPSQLLTVNIADKSYMLTRRSHTYETQGQNSSVPDTTQRYRKRKHEMEGEGVVKRKYNRKKVTCCRQCGQERIPPSHVQYFMNWFCAASSSISFEEWREEIKKRVYGKKQRERQ